MTRRLPEIRADRRSEIHDTHQNHFPDTGSYFGLVKVWAGTHISTPNPVKRRTSPRGYGIISTPELRFSFQPLAQGIIFCAFTLRLPEMFRAERLLEVFRISVSEARDLSSKQINGILKLNFTKCI